MVGNWYTVVTKMYLVPTLVKFTFYYILVGEEVVRKTRKQTISSENLCESAATIEIFLFFFNVCAMGGDLQ